MLAAQTVALVVGAALIAASDRLSGAVSSAMRAFVRELPRTMATGAAAAVTAVTRVTAPHQFKKGCRMFVPYPLGVSESVHNSTRSLNGGCAVLHTLI